LILICPVLSKGSVVSNPIAMKFGNIVLQLNTHRLTETDLCMTSYFKVAAITCASSSVRRLPAARRARVTSLARRIASYHGNYNFRDTMRY